MRRFASVLAVLSAFAIYQRPELLSADPAGEAVFPCKLGLEKKWATFAKNPPTADGVAALLEEDPDGGQLVPWSEARYTSIWAGLERRLAGATAVVAELRSSKEGEARALLETARSADDLGEIMAVARRCPWSDAAQKALLSAGEKELRRGNSGLAGRCFQDVLARAGDADLRARAQVGLWLAAGLDPRDDALEAAFHGIDLDARYPWLGGNVRAGDLRDRLRGGRTAPPAAAELKALDRRVLEVPSTPSWVSERPAVHAGGLSVSGPNSLAWFNGADGKPAWTQVFPLPASRAIWAALVPGPFQPAQARGKIFSRWGIRPVPQKAAVYHEPPRQLANVAAFDVLSGAQVWTTSSLPGWEEMCPATDPVHADGRLYLLTVSSSQEFSPLCLVCLDAETGSLLWKRELVTTHTTLAAHNGIGRQRAGGVDVAHYGNAVTVTGGRVYCLTNVGVVACCDARDGLIEWARSYPQDPGTATSRRQGASPLVAGGRILFLPRDADSLFALNATSGEMLWMKANEPARTALGNFNNSLILADTRKISALDADSGKVLWERPFQDSIEGRAVLAGPAIYAGTRASLYRLDARNGTIVEEHAWGQSGPMSGLAVRNNTLYGTTRGSDFEPAASADAPAPGDKATRVIHRGAQPLQIDGDPKDWEKLSCIDWSGPEGVKGKVLLSHDNRDLHVGVSAVMPEGQAGQEPLGPGSRLELGITASKKKSRWAVAIDPDGKAVWEGLGSAVPPEARAVVHRHLVDRVLTFELAVPLQSILAKDAKQLDWGRLALDLTLRKDARAREPVLWQGENLYLYRLTRDQESAAQDLARAVHDMSAAWEFREQAWRMRSPARADRAGFYRDLIKQEPKSPAAGRNMVRLDQLLRKSIDSDPSAEIVKLAAEVGVPEPVRAWYRHNATAYLSQWLYLDRRIPTQGIEIELFDGKSWDHRVTTNNRGDLDGNLERNARRNLLLQQPGLSVRMLVINGRVIINNRRVDPNQPIQPVVPAVPADDIKDIKSRSFPMPPRGAWHEVRIPLLWLDMHDRPIGGIAFSQRGGGQIYWDRTAVYKDGKETILIDDELTEGEPQGDWQWVADPVKSGQKAHTTAAPAPRTQSTRHAAYFKEPVRVHVTPEPDGLAVAPKQLLALVEAKLPGLRLDSFSAALYERADVLLRSDSDRRGALRQALLKKADPDDVPGWLEKFLRLEYASGADKPVESVAALIQTARLPDSVLADFRQQPSHRFLRAWQVLGPFANPEQGGHGIAYPPESEALDLGKEYDGVKGKIRWQLLASAADRIDLQKFFDYDKAGVAYAACWVHADTKLAALIEVGSHDGVKVWINPRTQPQPVIDEPVRREAAPGQNSAKIELLPGWNEILIKVDQRAGPWSFFAELRAPDNSRTLEGIKARGEKP